MNIKEKLDYFDLKENYTEKELNDAYQRKLEELNANYQLLKMKITKKDTLEYQNKTQEILNEIMWKIIFSKDIKEEEAMRLKIPLLKIKERIEQGTLDPDLLAYLSNLKFDGKKEDLLLLFAISKGINPQMKE